MGKAPSTEATAGSPSFPPSDLHYPGANDLGSYDSQAGGSSPPTPGMNLLRQLSLKRNTSLGHKLGSDRRGSTATANSSTSTVSTTDLMRRLSLRQSDGLTTTTTTHAMDDDPDATRVASTPVLVTPKPHRAQAADDGDDVHERLPEIDFTPIIDIRPPHLQRSPGSHSRGHGSEPILLRQDDASMNREEHGDGSEAGWAPTLPTISSPRAPSAPPATSRRNRDDIPAMPKPEAVQGSELAETEKRQRAEQQKRLKMLASLTELVDTERTYADDLAILVLVYFENLPRLPYFRASADMVDPAVKINMVCRNAEMLLRLHQQLSVKLEKILTDNDIREPKPTSSQGKSRVASSSKGSNSHRRSRSVGGEKDIMPGNGRPSSLEVAMSPKLDRATSQVAEELIRVVCLRLFYFFFFFFFA